MTRKDEAHKEAVELKKLEDYCREGWGDPCKDGHDWKDASSAGPDSGNADVECRRCGEYRSIPLY